MVISFSELVNKFNLKNQATSVIKMKEVLNNLGINANMRDNEFSTKDEIGNLHSTIVTHWVCYIDK